MERDPEESAGSALIERPPDDDRDGLRRLALAIAAGRLEDGT